MRTPRGKLAVLLGATLAFGLVAFAVATNHERLYRWWWNLRHGVPVVSMWRDLRGNPLVELEGNGAVRLGIEGTTVPAGRGVLVYCLVEEWPAVKGQPGSPQPSGTGTASPGVPLGPLRVLVERPEGSEAERLHAIEELARLDRSSSIPGLLAAFRSDPFGAAGKAALGAMERMDLGTLE